MTPRAYQLRASASLAANHRGIVKAPAGSGKTIIAAHALDDILTQRNGTERPIWWIANTIEQVEQGKAACAAFHQIAALAPNLKFACYAAQPDCRGSSLIILDECHHIASPENRKILDGSIGRRWGLSATPHRADELAPDVFKLIGPIVCEIRRDELVEAGNLAPALVRWHRPNHPGEFTDQIAAIAEPLIRQRLRFWQVPEDEVRKRTLWALAQTHGVFENAKRNACIAELAAQHAADSTLILVGSIEHGEVFAKQTAGAVMAHSKMGTKKRREAIGAFKAGDLRCLIATSLADEGLDVPCASVLILAAGGRSAAKSEQRTGRVLRPFDGKDCGIIHDFYDHQHYFLEAQSKARAKLYASLSYAT